MLYSNLLRKLGRRPQARVQEAVGRHIKMAAHAVKYHLYFFSDYNSVVFALESDKYVTLTINGL